MRRRTGAVVALLAALVLAGCGGLSTDSKVVSGAAIGSGEQAELRQYFPGPQSGANQESIVLGFIRAGAATDGDYSTARRFLTPSASESWNPDATLVLQSDDAAASIRRVDPSTLELTVNVAGTVGSTGRYRAARPDATVTARFAFVDVNDQWRIDSLPDGFGRWIKDSDVPRLVQPFSVHYVSMSRRSTVPDVRWFPLDRLAPRLARAQLDPVPDFLSGAAISAVPPGARLLGDAVSVDDNGVASVNLISPPLAAGVATRQNLYAQFLRTLTQDPEVSAVTLAVDGVPVDVDGSTRPVGSLNRVGFPSPATDTLSTKPVVRRDGEVTVFDPGASAQGDGRGPSSAPPSTPEYPAVPSGYSHLALSADGTELAALNPGESGLSRWRDGNRYEVPDLGSRLSAPAYDRRGYLWVGAVDSSRDRLFVVDTRADPADFEAAGPTPVVADWLRNRRVVVARVAADGDRVAVLSTAMDGTSPRVDLAGVVRGEGDRPVRLAAPLRLGIGFSSARGLTWVDDESVATIAAIGRGPLRPTTLTVGGDLRTLTEVPGAVEIATTGSDRYLYVVTSQGRLYMRVGPQWIDSGPAVDLAAPAG